MSAAQHVERIADAVVAALDHQIEAYFRQALQLTPQRCLRCGCTDDRACEEGCCWVTPQLCSSCADDGDVLASEMREGQRPARLQGPARYHTRTLTRPALHAWAPLTMRTGVALEQLDLYSIRDEAAR